VKVVIAHNRYRSDAPSGENSAVDAEIEQLTQAGVNVVPFLRSSDDIGALPLLQKATLPLSPIYSPWSTRAIDKVLLEHRPDVLHLHNPYPLLSPWVVRTAHRRGVPVVQTVHNYRQVCARGTYFRDGHICTDCKGKAFAWPAIQHKCYRDSLPQSTIMATALAAHRGTWRSVDRYIALTSQIADHLRDYGIPAGRIVVKPNAVDDPGPPPPIGEGVLYAGRLSPEKGLALLLDAWSRHPDGSLGTLRIAGDGELRPLAEGAAANRRDVSYLGPLDRAGVLAALAASALLAAPSAWQDVLPTSIIEALASGRPALGTPHGGIPFVVGDAGWIVEPDPAAWASALPAAVSAAGGLARKARERYESRFHPAIVTPQLIDVYAQLERRGQPGSS
jgi:glycosyltransferase involved in cell wall biosynthesis